ncbi:unnamed protein product [Nesidiocoris tenuis]|uniref:Uncharacterized protein n=1 Tax=Nesidiocoris tenuis TaxID=355587 RepID=A0A6H5GNJ7_9HEMI|nr:unnamed protein product [Nesidiocoris tenuis]CAB0005399.1 unnamed protein product [Nesidiocoris tenuis]
MTEYPREGNQPLCASTAPRRAIKKKTGRRPSWMGICYDWTGIDASHCLRSLTACVKYPVIRRQIIASDRRKPFLAQHTEEQTVAPGGPSSSYARRDRSVGYCSQQVMCS